LLQQQPLLEQQHRYQKQLQQQQQQRQDQSVACSPPGSALDHAPENVFPCAHTAAIVSDGFKTTVKRAMVCNLCIIRLAHVTCSQFEPVICSRRLNLIVKEPTLNR
jgi:hypothetical protein